LFLGSNPYLDARKLPDHQFSLGTPYYNWSIIRIILDFGGMSILYRSVNASSYQSSTMLPNAKKPPAQPSRQIYPGNIAVRLAPGATISTQ
jgi:hypothetical protein